MESIQPLSPPQKRLLQRLLACHVLPDNELQLLWDEIKNTVQRGEPFGRDVKHTVGLLNRSLKPAFGLEVRSVALSLNGSADPVVYHSIVNCHGDHVSTTFANPTLSKNPHEFAFFRLILERLVETFARAVHDEQQTENQEDDGDGDDSQQGARKRRRRTTRRNKGCQSSLSRIDMINLRTQLAGVHAGKLEIAHAENAINLFEAQGWLVEAANPNSSDGRRSSSAADGRRDRGASYLQLGARAYMEFPGFLEKAGLDKEYHPQFLLY